MRADQLDADREVRCGPENPGRLTHGTSRPDAHRLNIASPVLSSPAGASPGALAVSSRSNGAIAAANNARQRAMSACASR